MAAPRCTSSAGSRGHGPGPCCGDAAQGSPARASSLPPARAAHSGTQGFLAGALSWLQAPGTRTIGEDRLASKESPG